jgi:hypothetical protein
VRRPSNDEKENFTMSTASRYLTALAILFLLPNVTYAHSRQSLHDDMRRLWSDHVAYTRLFIVSAVAGAPDSQATLQRLLQNQTDIGNAVAGFYGKEAGDKLTALLKDHIAIAGNIVAAAKAGDNAKVASENELWKQNANDLAKFLSGANPKNWPLSTLQSALSMHLEQTLNEATHELKGNYAASLKDYDEAMDHMLMVADILTDGITKQFPSKFTAQ